MRDGVARNKSYVEFPRITAHTEKPNVFDVVPDREITKTVADDIASALVDRLSFGRRPDPKGASK